MRCLRHMRYASLLEQQIDAHSIFKTLSCCESHAMAAPPTFTSHALTPRAPSTIFCCDLVTSISEWTAYEIARIEILRG